MKFLYLYVLWMFTISATSQISYVEQRSASEKIIRQSKDFNTALHQELVNAIFPFWYGTQWDYNGYTNVPNDGVVACGYFVSTTLKHIGFNLNRYDIAKMYSSDIVKVLCRNDFWIESDFNLFLQKMTLEPDGLFIVGLSNHVGFIERSNGRTYFIHANYLGDNGVERELANDSEALRYSTTFWLGNFSNNEIVKQDYLSAKEFRKVTTE